jgi:hypothetical protein
MLRCDPDLGTPWPGGNQGKENGGKSRDVKKKEEKRAKKKREEYI